MRDAIADANALLAFATVCESRLSGMGTTLTAVALSNHGAYLIANVGDSRTYLLRDGRLEQLTRDDSLVQELLDRGVLDEDAARRHPQRSVVIQALDGVERPLAPLSRVPALPGDRLLLCSDGLSDYVSDDELAELLGSGDPTAAGERLVARALDHGSRDNVTAVIADVVPRGSPSEGWLPALPAAAAG